jgi:hypothetical protein
MTLPDFTTALEQDLQLRGVGFDRADVVTFTADVWPIAEEDPDPDWWAVKFLERRTLAKWLRVLRTTYLVVISVLAFMVALGWILNTACGHKPVCGYVLIGIWCIPGLYCFVIVLRENPPPPLPIRGSEVLKSRSLLSWVIIPVL